MGIKSASRVFMCTVIMGEAHDHKSWVINSKLFVLHFQKTGPLRLCHGLGTYMEDWEIVMHLISFNQQLFSPRMVIVHSSWFMWGYFLVGCSFFSLCWLNILFSMLFLQFFSVQWMIVISWSSFIDTEVLCITDRHECLKLPFSPH